jgi:hypothetical protein
MKNNLIIQKTNFIYSRGVEKNWKFVRYFVQKLCPKEKEYLGRLQ